MVSSKNGHSFFSVVKVYILVLRIWYILLLLISYFLCISSNMSADYIIEVYYYSKNRELDMYIDMYAKDPDTHRPIR